jgi:hypothetical protein
MANGTEAKKPWGRQKYILITHLPQLPPVRDKLRQINRLPDYASCAATQTSVQIMNIGRFQGSFSNGS